MKTHKKERSTDKIIHLLKDNPEMTRVDLAEACGLTVSRIEKIISQLKKEGILERVGSRKEGYWRINK